MAGPCAAPTAIRSNSSCRILAAPLSIPAEDATNFYKEFIAYLSSLGIKYHDLIAELAKRKINADDLFWVNNSTCLRKETSSWAKFLAEIL